MEEVLDLSLECRVNVIKIFNHAGFSRFIQDTNVIAQCSLRPKAVVYIYSTF